MTINQAVTDVICATLRLEPHQIRPANNLVEDLSADSLDVIEMRVGIEDRLDVVFTDAEWDAVKTVGDAIRLAVKKKELKLKGPSCS